MYANIKITQTLHDSGRRHNNSQG
uniref:Uncharacterized protein n=1 Tax=Anguilla anguilla TaxID=7936 RepID=A0A0E9R1C1_ANGAN